QSRIQDWIRYVQDHSQNLVTEPEETPEDSHTAEEIPRTAADSSRAVRPEIVSPAAAPSAPKSTTEKPRLNLAAARAARLGKNGGSSAPATARPAMPSQTGPEKIVAPPSEIEPVAQLVEHNTANPESIIAPPPEMVVKAASAVTKRGVVRPATVGRRQRVRPETRAEMLDRLLNPTISLHEASVILGVCSATVRRYTNSGVLPHVRTEGGQRRFRLKEVFSLLRELDHKKK
ncbi:MAG TPA: helix-turn-helix domain-containing protein, partial [Abditibacteriaceae bacterium]